MLILALEFSSPVRTVAVLSSTGPSQPADLVQTVSDNGVRSMTPLSLVNAALNQAKISAQEVEMIAVGLGPGSYTGIRSSIALGQGWQLAQPVRLTGMSSVEALALQAQDNGWFGDVTVAIDAQRGEVYLARYGIERDRREIREPLHLAAQTQFQALAATSPGLFLGPEIVRWCAGGRLAYPRAMEVGRLASLTRAAPNPSRQLEPIYLRETTFVKTAARPQGH